MDNSFALRMCKSNMHSVETLLQISRCWVAAGAAAPSLSRNHEGKELILDSVCMGGDDLTKYVGCCKCSEHA